MDKGYWIICKKSYEVDGLEIPKGRMHYHSRNARPLVNGFWRKATESEIETKQRFKGNFFNLKNV